MLNNLLDSEIFRDRLLRRYAELVGTVLADDYVLDRIDEYVALLRPEIARDHKRWASQWNTGAEMSSCCAVPSGTMTMPILL